MWILFVILSMLISGFLDIIEKKGSKDQPLYFWAQAVMLYGILNVFLGIILKPNIVFNFDGKVLLLTFPISFLSTLGYYCSVNAFKYSSISKVAPILRSKIILVLILSAMFIDDKLSVIQLILIFSLLVLNILLNKGNNGKRSKKGILFALGFVFSNGIATFLNKVVIDMIPDPISITFYIGLTTILSIFFMTILIQRIELLNVRKFKNKKYVLCMETLEVIAMILVRYAMIDGNVVIITAMTSSSIIIAIILSKLIFKEKISFNKWMIILLIVISLVLLSVLSI